MRRKFKSGQVVLNSGGFYVRITSVHKECDGWYYTTEWDGDADFDYVSQGDLRSLTKKEKG